MKLVLERVFEVYIIVSIILAVLFLPKIKSYFYGFAKVKHLENKEKNKFAIIIPARNESVVIRKLLDRISNQTYSHEYYDVHVIVADPKDRTIDICKEYEKTYVHIVTNQKNKGDALDGGLKEILAKDKDAYDAYIIVDADLIVEKNYLEEMNNSLAMGRDIVMGKKVILNLYDKSMPSNYVSSCTGMTFTFIDEMCNKYRSKKEQPCTVCGAGLLVTKKVIIDNNGWPYKTICEDYELLMDVLRKNYTTAYYPYALVYTEETTSHKQSFTRRTRWISGYSQVNGIYRKKIKKLTFHNETGHINYRNMDFLYGMFPVFFFFGISVTVLFANLITGGVLAIMHNSLWNDALLYGANVFILMYGLLFLFTLLGLIIDHKYIKLNIFRKIQILLVQPLFLMEYFPIFFTAFIINDDVEWVEIKRLAHEQ